MEAFKKRFRPEDLPKLERIHEAATELVKQHLNQPVRDMDAKGYKGIEVACAFIALGYHILRQNRSEKDALATFDALADYTRQRLETGRSRYMAKKLN